MEKKKIRIASTSTFFFLAIVIVLLPFLDRHSFCPDCSTKKIQILCLIGAFLGFLLNINVGIRSIHWGIILFYLIAGSITSLYQLCAHICPTSPRLGIQFCGMSSYTWFFLLFSFVICCVGVILILDNNQIEKSGSSKKNRIIANVIGILAILTNSTMYFF